MVFVKLSTGCLADIMSGCDYDKPVIQLLGTKRIDGNEGNVRYRLLVSDGKYLISYAMLAAQINSYADNMLLTDNTIIRIEKHIAVVVAQDKKVLVILALSVLHPGTEVKAKIGDPQPLTDAQIAAAANPVSTMDQIFKNINI